MARDHSLAVRRETLREQAGLPGDHSLRSAHLNPGCPDNGILELRAQIAGPLDADGSRQHDHGPLVQSICGAAIPEQRIVRLRQNCVTSPTPNRIPCGFQKRKCSSRDNGMSGS